MSDWFFKPQKEIYGGKKHRKIYKTDSRRLKFCTTCKRVYEWLYSTNNIAHYEDFPTYGLRRKECKECIKKGVKK